jgi:hypothetical protein
MTEVIAALNELLEAERAGVEVMSRLLAEAPTDELRQLFARVRDDEAWSCAGLAAAVTRLGARISSGKGDFAARVFAVAGLPARIRLLNRGQAWVARRLDRLLEQPLDQETASFLRAMRDTHVTNIESCERLLDKENAR